MSIKFWKENSLALGSDDNHIIYALCGCSDTDNVEKITLKITGPEATNPKIKYKTTISLEDAKDLLAMLQDIVAHADKTNEISKEEQ